MRSDPPSTVCCAQPSLASQLNCMIQRSSARGSGLPNRCLCGSIAKFKLLQSNAHGHCAAIQNSWNSNAKTSTVRRTREGSQGTN
eukprot:6198128-Amphidinium_carterae.1